MNIPLVDLKSQYQFLANEVDPKIKKIVSSGGFIKGAEVDKFEEEFADYISVKHCVTVNSGTDALILGIRGLELKPGDEIIIPANTFFATALGASENNLRPVFVDIDKSDFGIDLDDLRKKITKKTKAVIIVHLFGKSDKIDEIQEVINQVNRKILLIEDASQAHGAMYKGKKVGSFGIFATFSFYPGKNLGAYGDGGAIVTNNSKLANKFRLLSDYGQAKKYYHKTAGVNSKLDALQAGVLRIKLKHLDDWNLKRQNIGRTYSELFNTQLPEIVTPLNHSKRKSVFHLYAIRAKKRDKLIKYLHKHGVQALIHYPIPLHLQEAFQYLNYKKGDFPNSEKIAKEIISLPIFPEMSTRQIKYIIKSMKDFFKNA